MAKNYYYNLDDNAMYELAKDVANLYRNKEIVNYIHDGKPFHPKYEKLIERPITSIYSNIDGYISLQKILSNTIKYSFSKPTIKNTTNLKALKETQDRLLTQFKILEQNKSLENFDDNQYKMKQKELEMLTTQINNMMTNNDDTTNKKTRYLKIAEEAYNLLLRKDNVPKYFYIEVCKKLGVRINYEEHFIRENDNERISISNGVIKKDFKNKIDEEEQEIYKKQNKGRYIPPAFRKQDEIKIIKEEDDEITETIKQETKEETKEEIKVENIIPEFKPTNSVNLGVWGKKSTAIYAPVQNNKITIAEIDNANKFDESKIIKREEINNDDSWDL